MPRKMIDPKRQSKGGRTPLPSTAMAYTGPRQEKDAGEWVMFRDDFLKRTAGEQIVTIRNGVQITNLVGFANSVQAPRESVYHLVGVSTSTVKRKLVKGELLDAVATERLVRLGAIEKQAEDAFGNRDLAHHWLRTTNPGLGGVEPLSILDTEVGCREVSRVLNAIAYGGVA
ncbi:MAG: hypothetical protein H6R10_162 [Rhodocyclaceae bacterium]|nr:hypothetical protein [Rhodocyclaceae bacterium]